MSSICVQETVTPCGRRASTERFVASGTIETRQALGQPPQAISGATPQSHDAAPMNTGTTGAAVVVRRFKTLVQFVGSACLCGGAKAWAHASQ